MPPPRTANCATSVGTGGAAQEAELLNCLGDITFDTGTCPWFSTPPKPQSHHRIGRV